MNGKREFGDYQTPDYFSLEVCKYLKEKRKVNPSVVIEPTCGIGSFIKSSLMFDASEIIGIEINPEYCKICEKSIYDSRVRILNEDFFSIDFNSIIKNKEELLIVGNPPWVNNSTLSVLNSKNIPFKKNFKGLSGMEAMTGGSNFDICEYIILQLLASLYNTNTTIAMLCKTSVARNIFSEMKRTDMSFKSCDIFEFNAGKVFGINANACLLVIELSKKYSSPNICNVHSFNEPQRIKKVIGYKNGAIVNNVLNQSIDFSGTCCFEWRQGVKHDCAKVMELSFTDNQLINGFKDIVDIEEDYVYPLIKSSMFKSPVINCFEKYVIVTQKKVKEDTSHIKLECPKTWEYLLKHKEKFEKRKSSIYRNSPDFSMFGVGDYSYKKYKVGISGFYKKPLFSLLVSDTGKPVMTDDTSYFICFPTYDTAYTAMLILNSEPVQNFLLNIAFLDSKRPFTKKVLTKLDFRKILEFIKFNDIVESEKTLGLMAYFNEFMLNEFKNLPEFRQEMFL